MNYHLRSGTWLSPITNRINVIITPELLERRRISNTSNKMSVLSFIHFSKIKSSTIKWLIGCSRTFSLSNSLSDRYKWVYSIFEMYCWPINFINSFHRCETLVIGGGTAGCAIAAKLSSRLSKDRCIVLEPASEHYYQPMFTMIGGGMKSLSQSRQSMVSVLPKNAKWITDSAAQFNPDANEVITELGHIINYDIVVIAVGLQLNYDKVINKSKWDERRLMKSSIN